MNRRGDGVAKAPEQTVRRILQQLRDQGILEFLDDRGAYRLLK